MRRYSRTARLVRIALTVLQLVLPGALSIADALLERAANSPAMVASDFETQGGAPRRAHVPDCALCQFLATAPVVAQRVALELPATTHHAAPSEYAPPHGRADVWRASLPRAPPGS